MFKRILVSIIALALLIPSISYGQSGVTTFIWDYAAPKTDVDTITQVVTVDGTILITPITCVATSATLTTCSIAAPTLSTGVHTVSVAATRSGITTETRMTNFGGGLNPPNAVNPRLNITFNITIK